MDNAEEKLKKILFTAKEAKIGVYEAVLGLVLKSLNKIINLI